MPAFGAASSAFKRPPRHQMPPGSTHVRVRSRRMRIACCDGFRSTSARAPKRYGAPPARERYRPPSPRTVLLAFETGYTRCTVASPLRYCWVLSQVAAVGPPSALSPSVLDYILDQAYHLEDGLQWPRYITDVSMVSSPLCGRCVHCQAVEVANCVFCPSSGIIELLRNVVHVRLCRSWASDGMARSRTRSGRSKDKSRHTLVQMEGWLGILLQVLDVEFHRTRVDDSKSPAVAASRHADFAGFHSGELAAIDDKNCST